MKIYFGRHPDTNFLNLDDSLFPLILRTNDYNFSVAVDKLVEYIHEYNDDTANYYTCNPLIINYFDDEFANKYIFFIDEFRNEIVFGTDESCQKKIKFMGPGEILADDERVFK